MSGYLEGIKTTVTNSTLAQTYLAYQRGHAVEGLKKKNQDQEDKIKALTAEVLALKLDNQDLLAENTNLKKKNALLQDAESTASLVMQDILRDNRRLKALGAINADRNSTHFISLLPESDSEDDTPLDDTWPVVPDPAVNESET